LSQILNWNKAWTNSISCSKTPDASAFASSRRCCLL
jgi:hypothetical protein